MTIFSTVGFQLTGQVGFLSDNRLLVTFKFCCSCLLFYVYASCHYIIVKYSRDPDLLSARIKLIE